MAAFSGISSYGIIALPGWWSTSPSTRLEIEKPGASGHSPSGLIIPFTGAPISFCHIHSGALAYRAAYTVGTGTIFTTHNASAAGVLYSQDTVTRIYDNASPAVVEIAFPSTFIPDGS